MEEKTRVEGTKGWFWSRAAALLMEIYETGRERDNCMIDSIFLLEF